MTVRAQKQKSAKTANGRQIEYLPTESLIPYARNARTHSDTQVSQIAGSIQEFGWTNPVLIDADGVIIAGHGRVLAAQRLTLGSVPCIRLTHLTDAQKRAYVIADNRLALNAGWDSEMLAEELKALQADIGLTLLGFSDDDLSAALGTSEDIDGQLKKMQIQNPPKMTWVLIGIPTVEFGSINEMVEGVAAMPTAIVEVTANDG